jgi:AraC-like DNA-binding protein
MDILFSLSGTPSRPDGARDDPYVVGAMTRALHVESRGVVDLIGVRFSPGGAMPYLSTPASDLTDQIARLDDLWGAAAAEAYERLREAGDLAGRIAVLDDVLLGRLSSTKRAPDERVLTASELVSAHSGSITVQGLAEATGLGRRQLERRFLAVVGTSPKVAARIARFRGSVSRLHRDPEVDLSGLALDSGYADQAHFTREFKALAGVTPGAYRRGIG